MINVSYFWRSAAAGVFAAPLWNARSSPSRSSTWFFSESFVNTPMAFVSFKRCSSEPKSSVGVLGASAAAGFVACTGAGAAGFGWAAPVVAPGVGSRRLEGVPGEALDEALDDELLGGVVAVVAAGATGAGTGAAAGGAGSGAIFAGTCVVGRGAASAAGRG